MGYMTSYELTWDKTKASSHECPHCKGTGKLPIEDVIQEYVDTAPICYNNTEPIASNLEDSVKWYDHEVDMKRLSKEFPDVLFTLRGEGEEAGDIWVKYFKSGKMQTARAKIELEEFDPKKLG